MFYYDTRMKVCQPFSYHGCAGNDNKYESAQDCKSTCVTKTGGAGTTSASSTSPRSSTNSTSQGKVPPFVPEGNSHGQWRKAELCSSNYLIPNGQYVLCQDYVCSLRDDNGHFQDGVEDRPRFGWDHNVKNCVRFSYYGRDGNYNNFPNFPSCVAYCKDSKKVDTSG
ncbi:hypothetical protein WR25_03067 [Diploscapter pachys]|uniref:BPTI/Kunitz inhibitor domain-containing protein n=1 Tax=Diploscapter pachys TaxID=2018661 RepID=A0A2A2KBG6_9BILA|nr:hypothetical protein WR25_03067 [Diploscapter pachys]